MKSLAVTFVLVAMLIMLVLIAAVPFTDSNEYVVFASSLYLLVAGLTFLSIILDSRRGGISFMFEFFMLFFIALPASIQINAGVFPWFARLNAVDIVWAYGLIALSHFVFHFVWLLQSSRRQGHENTASTLSAQNALFYTKWAWSFAVISLLFSLLAGFDNLVIPRFDSNEAWAGGMTQQFLFMCRSISLLAMIMMLYLSRYTSARRLRRQNRLGVLVYLPIFMIINYLPALPRFVLFGLIIALSTLFIDYFRLKNKAAIAFFSVPTLFIIFPVIKSLGGDGGINFTRILERAELSIVRAYLLRVDFDAFVQITSTVQYVREDLGPFLWGENFLGVVLFFIPRAIWASKPIGTGLTISEALSNPYTNVSSPLPAEALMGLGVFGPILVFGLLAHLVQKFERGARPSVIGSPQASAFFIYAISMGFVVIILRGSLNSVAPQFATAYLAYFAMNFIKSNELFRSRKPML